MKDVLLLMDESWYFIHDYDLNLPKEIIFNLFSKRII